MGFPFAVKGCPSGTSFYSG